MIGGVEHVARCSGVPSTVTLRPQRRPVKPRKIRGQGERRAEHLPQIVERHAEAEAAISAARQALSLRII